MALFNMRWKPSTGYDCIDSRGKKVQVKSRRDSKGGLVNKRGRMGRFQCRREFPPGGDSRLCLIIRWQEETPATTKKSEYGFDRGLYVELDGDFNVVSIYEVPRNTIRKLENVEGGGKGLHIRTFVKHAGEPLYRS